MSVYKELIHGIKEVENKSKQIYPDACDFGVPVKDVNDPIINMVKGLKEQYDGNTVTTKYDTGGTQVTTIKGLDEWDTGKPFYVRFIWVTTRGDKSGMIGYLYVEADEPR